MSKHTIVGKQTKPQDAYDKVTGKAVYVGDMKFQNLLYGKILRSPHPHAMVKHINTSDALSLPGVKCVLTYDDVPQTPFTTCGHPLPFEAPLDSHIFEKHVRYVGDAIAAVAAETPEIAKKALSLIEVTYEQLPFYLTPDEALAEDALELHEGSKNIAGEISLEIGDVEQAFQEAAYIIEDKYDSPIVVHAAIEPHISVVDIDCHTGRLTFYVSTQVPTIMRERLAYILGLKRNMVRIVNACVGGGFGGKQEPIFEFINAVLTQRCGCPVQLELTREETLSCTRTRHSAHFEFKTSLDKNGRITARDMKVVQNTGAYSSHGHSVILNQFGQFDGLYPAPNMRFHGRTVYTNIQIAAAMRGYGIPQYCIANESHIDHLAAVAGMDPLEFRRQNLYKLGDEVKFGRYGHYTCGLPEILEKGEKGIGYHEFMQNDRSNGRIRRGVGMALATYASCVFPHSCELSGVRIMVHDDASATLFTGTAELGQGINTALAQIAAEALGIPYEWIKVVGGDTDICPADAGAYASRQTYVAGNAAKRAALECKQQILERSIILLKERHEMQIDAKNIDTRNGFIINVESGKEMMSMESVMEDIIYHKFRGGTCCHEVGHVPTDNVITYAGSFASVTVDMETGKVEVEKLFTCVDCGNRINPNAAIGQLVGGSVMSLGFGLMEQLLVDKKTGKINNDNLLDYKIPTMADIPEIEAVFVETYDPSSAYGNKSLGEPPNITPAAAIQNAVRNAIGFPVGANPLTPERTFAAINRAKKQ